MRSGSASPISASSRVFGPTGIPFNDIEFQAGGDVGFAVGDGGVVLRSPTAGSFGSWTSVNTPANRIPASNEGDGSGNKCTINTPLGDVHFVRFAGNGRVWVGSGPRQLSTSQTNNPATVGNLGTWKDANRKIPPVAGDNCYIPFDDGFGDMFFTANPDVFFIAADTATVWYSTSNLTSTAAEKPAGASNGFNFDGALAGDPAQPEPPLGGRTGAVRQFDRAVHGGRLRDGELVQRRQREQPSVPRLRHLRHRLLRRHGADRGQRGPDPALHQRP